jgi:hypothetical protein
MSQRMNYGKRFGSGAFNSKVGLVPTPYVPPRLRERPKHKRQMSTAQTLVKRGVRKVGMPHFKFQDKPEEE